MRAGAALLTAIAALTLTGCASTPPVRGPMLGPVDLSRPFLALGTEPFWDVEFTGSEVRFRGMDTSEPPAPQPAPELSGATAVYRTRLPDGRPLITTLSVEDCSDGMSDRIYPLTAVVMLGDGRLEGCAASVSAIEKTRDDQRTVD